MKRIILPILSLALLASCSKVIHLTKSFEESPLPEAPNYANPDHWAALPTKEDMADGLPGGEVGEALQTKGDLQDRQADAPVDVFFLYPTIYSYEPTQPNQWNADVNDPELNQRIDDGTIKHQASVFNGVGKIYAPRYRQGHYYMYQTENKADAEQALAVAYQDVLAAFDYYMEHHNQGRPFIVAGHSQGSQLGRWLVRDRIDGTALQNQLVAAYLVGWAIPSDFYDSLQPCTTPDQIGCWVTWNTKAYNHYPSYYHEGLSRSFVINPITWRADEPVAEFDQHAGLVNPDFELTEPGKVDATVHEGLLWIHTPKVPGAKLLNIKNWHRGDYNLFWLDVRRNAQFRVAQYLIQHPEVPTSSVSR